MIRDDIIRMAREARLVPKWRELCPKDEKALVRFAALVAAAKDAEHQQTLALQQRSYEREIQLEVEAEREACAKIVETHQCTGWGILSAAIRARSKE